MYIHIHVYMYMYICQGRKARSARGASAAVGARNSVVIISS